MSHPNHQKFGHLNPWYGRGMFITTIKLVALLLFSGEMKSLAQDKTNLKNL